MTKADSASLEGVRHIFGQANFIRDLNIHLDNIGAGTCETSLVVEDRLRQQHGFVHGGVSPRWPTIQRAALRAPSPATGMC